MRGTCRRERGVRLKGPSPRYLPARQVLVELDRLSLQHFVTDLFLLDTLVKPVPEEQVLLDQRHTLRLVTFYQLVCRGYERLQMHDFIRRCGRRHTIPAFQ